MVVTVCSVRSTLLSPTQTQADACRTTRVGVIVLFPAASLQMSGNLISTFEAADSLKSPRESHVPLPGAQLPLQVSRGWAGQSLLSSRLRQPGGSELLNSVDRGCGQPWSSHPASLYNSPPRAKRCVLSCYIRRTWQRLRAPEGLGCDPSYSPRSTRRLPPRCLGSCGCRAGADVGGHRPQPHGLRRGTAVLHLRHRALGLGARSCGHRSASIACSDRHPELPIVPYRQNMIGGARGERFVGHRSVFTLPRAVHVVWRGWRVSTAFRIRRTSTTSRIGGLASPSEPYGLNESFGQGD